MRREREAPDWLKLDNAAKIYPPTRSNRWAAMFRLSVTLTEPVDPSILQKAQDAAIRRIATFSYRLRRGLFWYYFQRMDGAPPIQEDVANPLVRIDLRENGHFMFRVRYFDCRIAVEIFHALTDGTGGLTFLLTMTAEYLRLRYGDRIEYGGRILDCRKAPKREEMEDAFLRCARGVGASRRERPAYHIPGTDTKAGFPDIITGIMPIAAVRDAAKARGCTVTVLLTSLLVLATQEIQKRDSMGFRSRKPIKVSVPVDLRKFYPTETLRNFSSYVNVGIDSALGEHTLEEIIVQVKHTMGMEITEKKLNARVSANVNEEKKAVVRAMPLVLKAPVMKAAFTLQGDRYCSTTLSNLGLVTLPEKMAARVKRLDMILGMPHSNAGGCACISCAGKLVISCTRVIRETDMERFFFTSLIKLGIPVRIESNRRC